MQIVLDNLFMVKCQWRSIAWIVQRQVPGIVGSNWITLRLCYIDGTCGMSPGIP
jgi:hypothetical protein